MVEAFDGDFRAVLGLGEDKGALQHRLGVKREALRSPRRLGRVERLGGGEVAHQPVGVLADVAVAGLANGGMGFVGLLHHRAEQAGELRQLALKNSFAEIYVAERARRRIGQGAIQYAQAGRVLQQVLETSASLQSDALLDAFKKVNIPFGDPNLYVAKPKGIQFADDRLLKDGSAMFIQWTPEQSQQVVFPKEFAQTAPRARA